MIQSSIPQNQLKFNLDTATANINLINVVHNPQSISILKESKSKNFSREADRNVNNIKSSFEYIDEEKLSMYAFLVKRDIRTKEWLGKYDQHDHEQLNEAMSSFGKSDKVNNSTAPKPETQPTKSIIKKKTEQPVKDTAKKPSSTPPILNTKSDHADINKCCVDSVSSIEFLQKQLSEFKYERLKVVFNDPAEEEKQRRIQMEQIKYLSRSMYNLQNQMSRFSTMYAKETTDKKRTDVLKRIIHTMKQVVKTTQVFGEAYPYRPDDGQITEKLCAHFYKQLHSSVANFSNCVNELTNSDIQPGDITYKLTNLLLSCDKYFINEPTEPKQPTKPQKPQQQQHQQPKKSALKVIRTSRLPGSSKKPITGVIKKTIKPINKKTASIKTKNLVQKPQGAAFNISFSPTRKPQQQQQPQNKAYEQKTIKTARLFPSKLPSKSASNLTQFRSRSQSAERINHSRNSLNNSVLSDSFKHLSSPTVSTLKKMGRSQYNSNENFKITKPRSYSNPSLNRSSQSLNNSRSRSPNRSLNSVTLSPTKYNSFQRNLSVETMNRSLTDLRSKYEYDPVEESKSQQFLFNFNESYEKPKYLRMKSPTKPILKNDYYQVRSHSSYQKGFESTGNILSRLDRIQRESNAIRRKYESINYEETLKQQTTKPRRPYEECYLVDAATVQEQYETKVTYDDTFLKMNPPSNQQLQRVLNYAKNFADYSQKTSVTSIGESKFDDFELFEYLSNELFEENFNSIFNELEQINQEFTSNLIANEFVDNTNHVESYSSSEFED